MSYGVIKHQLPNLWDYSHVGCLVCFWNQVPSVIFHANQSVEEAALKNLLTTCAQITTCCDIFIFTILKQINVRSCSYKMVVARTITFIRMKSNWYRNTSSLWSQTLERPVHYHGYGLTFNGDIHKFGNIPWSEVIFRTEIPATKKKNSRKHKKTLLWTEFQTSIQNCKASLCGRIIRITKPSYS